MVTTLQQTDRYGRKAKTKISGLGRCFSCKRGSSESSSDQNRVLLSSSARMSTRIYSHIDFLGNNRRQLLLENKEKMVGSLPTTPSRDPCLNQGGYCQPGPSTLIIIITGMTAMTLLVAIAIVLLCLSHFKYRRTLQASMETSGPTSTLPEQSSCTSCDNMVLVLLPGEKHPVTCAWPHPLIGEATCIESEKASSAVEEKPVHTLTRDCRDGHQTL